MRAYGQTFVGTSTERAGFADAMPGMFWYETDTGYFWIYGVDSAWLQAFSTAVTSARAINTTAPLSGGGDLSADRTIALTVPLSATYGGTGKNNGTFVLTIPATGTAALLGVANTFTLGPQTVRPGADGNKGIVIRAHSATSSAVLLELQNSNTSVQHTFGVTDTILNVDYGDRDFTIRHTSGNLFVANVGLKQIAINGASATAKALYVTAPALEPTGAGTNAGVDINITVTPTAEPPATYYSSMGVLCRASANGGIAYNFGTLVGGSFFATSYSTTAKGTIIGGIFTANMTQASTFDRSTDALIGGRFTSEAHVANFTAPAYCAAGTFTISSVTSGVVDLSYGILIQQGARTTTTGSMTSQYGIYIEPLTKATTNYAIVAESGTVILNESGVATSDFRVESDTEANMLFLDADADTDGAVYIGGTTNGIKITKGGSFTLLGTATVFDDIQFPVASGKVPAANAPNWEAFTTNTSAYAFSVDDYIDVQAGEPPHGWAEGTLGECHIHLTLKTANSSGANRFVKFTVWLAIADVSGVWTEFSPLSAEKTIPNGAAALTHYLLDMGDVTLTGYHIGCQLTARVKRIAATGGTEYADDVFITQAGMHVAMDRIGSNTEYAS